MAQVARLPEDKLCALQEVIHSWRNHRWCTRRQLESLIGHLHDAAKAAEFHLDLQWWFQFLSSWNGVAFWLFPGMAAAPWDS